MKKITLIVAGLVFLPGCLLNNIDTSKIKLPNLTNSAVENKVADPRGVIPKLVTSLKDAPKEDCVTLYKLYSGVAMYIEKSSGVSTTTQVVALASDVAKDYGWVAGKYPDFKAIVKADLESQTFDDKGEVKNLSKPVELTNLAAKSILIESYKVYAEAAKVAAEGK